MKYINKQDEPIVLIKFIKNKKTPNYFNLNPKQKKTIRKKLLEDQGYICCYCQKRIDSKKVDGQVRAEIEHIKAQSNCTDIETVQYQNLLISCDGNQQKNNKNIDEKDRHCNNFRQNKDLFINLLDSSCEDLIFYDDIGNIHAKDDDEKINITIDNLNLRILKANRKAHIDGFFSVHNRSTLTYKKLINQIKTLSLKSNLDNDGIDKYQEYSGVIINLLKQLGGI